MRADTAGELVIARNESGRRLTEAGIEKVEAELTREYIESLPMQPNVLRCQFACQWNGDERSERYFLNARVFADHLSGGSADG